MREKIGGLFVLLLLCFLVWGSQKLSSHVIQSSAVAEKKSYKEIRIIIDAGHGGQDVGKIGINDAVESEINLKIVKLLQAKLQKDQVQVLLTREDADGMAEGNIEDLKARVSMINREKPDLVVSIHQNSYHDASVKGAQVFYYEHSEEGKEAAEIMQKALLSLDESNKRQAKANTTYYVLKKTEPPVIIVECGFLSNPEEAEKLITDAYQEQVAEAVQNGIYMYFGIAEN